MNNNKPTVWVFGDSFSEDVSSVDKECLRWTYINKYLNGIPYPSWGEILSDKMQYNYKNFAAISSYYDDTMYMPSNSNDGMLRTVNNHVKKFKKNDIIFLGFTNIERYDYPIKNKSVQILPEYTEKMLINDYKNLGVDYVNKTLYHRSKNSKFYIKILMNNLKTLEHLSNIIGFNLFYWAWPPWFEDDIYEMKLSNKHWIFHQMHDYANYMDMIERYDERWSIRTETNNDIKDDHTGKIGNEIHANVLFEYLKKNLTFN